MLLIENIRICFDLVEQSPLFNFSPLADKRVMNQIQAWMGSFSLTKEQVEQWEQQLPKGKSVIRWILENNKIAPDAFLLWAKKNYQLPILKESFSDFKSASEIKNRYSNIWPDHVAPIADWDGTLFLACLEPVIDFQCPQNHQWVLAPLSMIIKLRGEAEVAPPQQAPLADAPAGLKVEALASVSFDKLSLDAPAGLNFAAPPPPPSKPESLDSKTRIIEGPAGLNFNLDEPPVAAAPPVAAPPIVPPPPIPNITSISNIAPPAMTLMSETGVRGFEDVGSYLLTEMSKHFEKSIILLFNQERLEVWKCSAGWARDTAKSGAIDLSGASIFRIVNETKNSYHGPVVPNPINDAFFEAWHGGKYPEHVTISPILIGKNLSGMILGVASKAKGQSLSLSLVERLAEKAGELLVKWGPSKAA